MRLAPAKKKRSRHCANGFYRWLPTKKQHPTNKHFLKNVIHISKTFITFAPKTSRYGKRIKR